MKPKKSKKSKFTPYQDAIIVEQVTKKPYNLQTAFKTAAVIADISAEQAQGRWYSFLKYKTKCFRMTANGFKGVNVKNYFKENSKLKANVGDKIENQYIIPFNFI